MYDDLDIDIDLDLAEYDKYIKKEYEEYMEYIYQEHLRYEWVFNYDGELGEFVILCA